MYMNSHLLVFFKNFIRNKSELEFKNLFKSRWLNPMCVKLETLKIMQVKVKMTSARDGVKVISLAGGKGVQRKVTLKEKVKKQII